MKVENTRSKYVCNNCKCEFLVHTDNTTNANKLAPTKCWKCGGNQFTKKQKKGDDNI